MFRLSDKSLLLSVLRLVFINCFCFLSSFDVISPSLSDLGLIFAMSRVDSGFTLLDVLSPYFADLHTFTNVGDPLEGDPRFFLN